MFKYCPNCGKRKALGWKYCPYCDYKFEEINLNSTQEEVAGAAQEESASDFFVGDKQTENKLRVMIIRGMYGAAEVLCNKLIDNDPMDRAGYIGLVRIASRNYKLYEGEEIAEQIRVAEEVFAGTDTLLADSEYVQYIAARRQYLEGKTPAEAAEPESAPVAEEPAEAPAEAAEPESVSVAEEPAEAPAEAAEPESVLVAEELAEEPVEAAEPETVPVAEEPAEAPAEAAEEPIGGNDPDEEEKRRQAEIERKRAEEEARIAREFEIEHGILKKYKGRDSVVTIPDAVRCIGEEAFAERKTLTGVVIPAGVTRIEESAFYLSGNLTSIEVAADNPAYTSVSGCLTTKDEKTLLRGTSSGNIPESVTRVGYGAFSSCEAMTSVSVPASVLSIGDGAFSFCRALREISLPEGITRIGDNTFLYCSALTAVSVPASVTSIGDGAFSFCRALRDIAIPNSVTRIGDLAFSCCDSLTKIVIPASVTSIGDNAFAACSHLTNIEVAADNPAYASVSNCLTTKDEKTLLRGTSAGIVPSGVTCIGRDAFSGLEELTNISIPDGVKTIGKSAFSGCEALSEIKIPDSVKSIGKDAFWGCNALKRVSVPNLCRYEGNTFPDGCEVIKRS